MRPPQLTAGDVRGHGRPAVLLLLLLLPLTVLLAGAAAAPVEVRAALGLDGWVVPGKVVPLRVDVRSSGALAGTIVVEVPSGVRGALPVRYTHPLRLPAGGRHQVDLDVIVRDPRRPVAVTIRDARGVRGRQELPLGAGRSVEGVVAALTREAAGLEFLADREEKRRPAYIAEADLPVRWQTYEAVDLLIVHDLDPRLMLPAQAQALVEWIAQGGRLLVVGPRLSLTEAPWLRELVPSAGRRIYGRGIVVVASEDLFAAARRARGELRAQVLALLDRRGEPPLADPALADVLPSSRPLSGRAQSGLAVLSVLYILAARPLLRRFGATGGGWIILAAFVAGATAALYGFAAAARTAATSLSQLSVAQTLGSLDRAQVITYASVVAPYGGRFVVRVPDGVSARPLGEEAVTYDEGAREIFGSATTGQVVLVARQLVTLRASARLAGDRLVVDRGAPVLEGAVLYRRRHLYRLPRDLGGGIRLDPARWEPLERPGALGAGMAGRALDHLFRQLDRAGDATWLLGRMADDRLGLRTERGAGGEAVRLLVTEVR